MLKKTDEVDIGDDYQLIKKIRNLVPSRELADDIVRYLKVKRSRFKGLSDLQRANLFWKMALKDEHRLISPQHPGCEFAIVVPVYNEKKERIIRQIDSLRRQKEIDPEKFEVIYIVNNGPANESGESLRAIDLNKEVIEALISIRDLNVFVIDKCTPGNEIEACNVGKARNRGTAEASLRFFENSRNGFLIHTDADSYFEDVFYFKNLISILKERVDTIGLAGGLIWEFNPDGNNIQDKHELYKKTKQLVLRKKWEVLYGFLTGVERYTNKSYKTAFWGGHMISRSYESAVIGGFFDGNAVEDEVFGLELEYHAAGRGLKLAGVKDRLFLVTALRESTRTDGSIGRLYDDIFLGKPRLVPDPLASETVLQFRERVKRILSARFFDLNDLRKILTDPTGNLVIRESVFDDLAELFKPHMQRNAKPVEDIDFITDVLYNILYPKITMAEEYYNKMVKKVSEDPDGAELLYYINLMERDF